MGKANKGGRDYGWPIYHRALKAGNVGSYSFPLVFKASFSQSLYKDEVNSRGEHEGGIGVIGSWSRGTPL